MSRRDRRRRRREKEKKARRIAAQTEQCLQQLGRFNLTGVVDERGWTRITVPAIMGDEKYVIQGSFVTWDHELEALVPAKRVVDDPTRKVGDG